MTKPGFYKYDQADNLLRFAPTYVYAPNYTLLADQHETYTYPVDGWTWFETTEAAEAEFGLNGASNARWQEFAAVLSSDQSVNQMIAAALQAAPVLGLMLGVGLGQAAEGNPGTFSTAWGLALAGGLVTPQLAAYVQGLTTGYDLPASFVAMLNPTP